MAEQPNFGGAITVHSTVRSGTPIIAVRPNAISPEPVAGGGRRGGRHASPPPHAAKAAKVTERVVAEKGERPELSEAQIVVSGGRGTGSADGFGIIEQLADALGAAVGASRAVVDAGWYPHAFQVGQTGEDGFPAAVSGGGDLRGDPAPGRGCRPPRRSWPSTRTPRRPIFEIADFGVVGDLFTVVPQLIDDINKHKG